jgi:hypothetical protein
MMDNSSDSPLEYFPDFKSPSRSKKTTGAQFKSPLTKKRIFTSTADSVGSASHRNSRQHSSKSDRYTYIPSK